MGHGGEVEEGSDIQFSPTWIVAVVCTVIVAVSFSVERCLHYLGKILKKNNQTPLFQALQKIKEELMLLGFISLLLAITQNGITKICVPKEWTLHMLPCSLEEKEQYEESKLSTNDVFGKARRLLGDVHSSNYQERGYCATKGKLPMVPLLSVEALHHLHVFIFVLAVVHVTSCVLTIVFGGLNIRRWKHWEDSIVADESQSQHALERADTVTHVHQHAFIKDHFTGIGKDSAIRGWLKSFFKQFYGSVTRVDYVTLRLAFIMTHCKGNPKFNFHKYMNRALEDDFKKVVGISWYLWVFVVIFLLLNIHGWHTYFWIAFIPVILLLAVGTKLEHVMIQLAHEVAEKHSAILGELVVQPSDGHFWFHRPRIVLFLIHLILFQNSFEITFFFWILITYGFKSCIMGKLAYIIPRLVIGVFIQVLCSYSTLPLYAIVTQMRTHFKNAIFDEQVQAQLVGGAQKAKKKRLRAILNFSSAGCLGSGKSQGSLSSEERASKSREIDPHSMQNQHQNENESTTGKTFISNEMFDGEMVNVVEGLKLYEDLFDSSEVSKLGSLVNDLRVAGRKGQFQGSQTYVVNKRPIRGHGREMIQLGVPVADVDNVTMSLKDKNVESMPSLFQDIIERMAASQVMTVKPDACIVDFYNEGDHSTPNIYPSSFGRPVYMLFLTECDMTFGRTFVSEHFGDYRSNVKLSLGPGSFLVMQGKSADFAKHAIPSIHKQRIVVTFVKSQPKKSLPIDAQGLASPATSHWSAAPSCHRRIKSI